MKVVHVAFECAPIYKTGGLGDVAGSLPKALLKLGIETSVVMPGYHFIKRVPFLPGSQVPVHYVESPLFTLELIKKNNPRLVASAYAHFALETLELLKRETSKPDIIHCHDWHAALIPVLLKKCPDSFFKDTKTILTLHNIAYQGNFPAVYFEKGEFTRILSCFPRSKRVSFLREGILCADFLTTVSPTHAREIKYDNLTFGLKTAIKKKRGRFAGILNGLDLKAWNPGTDSLIHVNYNRTSAIKNKSQNKTYLQKELGLEVSPDIPLFGFVARLTGQKGLEILLPFLSQVPRQRIQIVILGSGERRFETVLAKLKKEIDRRWYAVEVKFDERLAHQIYAGSDFFLVPSMYEPCGLTQMIACVYGSVPIVTHVGGLADTVTDGKNGIVLSEKTPAGLVMAMERANAIWENKETYREMVERALRKDFSWGSSAKKYIKLYTRLKRKTTF